MSVTARFLREGLKSSPAIWVVVVIITVCVILGALLYFYKKSQRHMHGGFGRIVVRCSTCYQTQVVPASLAPHISDYVCVDCITRASAEEFDEHEVDSGLTVQQERELRTTVRLERMRRSSRKELKVQRFTSTFFKVHRAGTWRFSRGGPTKHQLQVHATVCDLKAASARKKKSGCNSRDECKICMDDVASIVFLPCGHGGLCEGCAKDIITSGKECHICREDIDLVAQIGQAEPKCPKLTRSNTKSSCTPASLSEGGIKPLTLMSCDSDSNVVSYYGHTIRPDELCHATSRHEDSGDSVLLQFLTPNIEDQFILYAAIYTDEVWEMSQVEGRWREISVNEASDAVRDAHISFVTEWGKMEPCERAEHIGNLGKVLTQVKDECSALAHAEMGKPISQGIAEVVKCTGLCEYYSSHGVRMVAAEPVTDGLPPGVSKCSVVYNPIGVILGCMPWNFPFWQVIRWAVPVLMAGNTVVLKHASNVQGCAHMLQKVFLEAGFPRNAFVNIAIAGSHVHSVVSSPLVRGVALTGSEDAGRSIAGLCGRLLKPCVVELGGSDPSVVLSSTGELKSIARKLVAGRVLVNSGQSCVGPKRGIVVGRERCSKLAALIVEEVKKLEVDRDYGVMSSVQARDELNKQVHMAIAQGAKMLYGGVPDTEECMSAAHYKPTVLVNVESDSEVFKNETFGPVIPLTIAESDEEAIKLANSSPFGLGASVYTTDTASGEIIASNEIEAGMCFVNDFVKSHFSLPFGGIKNSGFGRECGVWGVRSFMNVKTVCVAS